MNPENEAPNVWIAGSGRSGTTWLSRMLTSIRGSKLIYEPLHPRHVSLPQPLQPPMRHVDERPYIRPDMDAKEWATFIDELYAGRYQNRWTGFSGMKKSLIPGVWLNSLFAHRHVVKSIRSNLLLGWLSRNPDYKVVLLLRHPGATLLSQQQRNWGVNLSFLTSDAELQKDYLKEYNTFFNKNLSELSQRAARWGIENGVPLQQIRDGSSIYMMTYEDLVIDPLGQLHALLDFLGWKVKESQLWQVESRVNVGYSGLGKPRSKSQMLSGWKDHWSKEQIDEILETVRLFGVDLYDADALPESGSHLKSEYHTVDE